MPVLCTEISDSKIGKHLPHHLGMQGLPSLSLLLGLHGIRFFSRGNIGDMGRGWAFYLGGNIKWIFSVDSNIGGGGGRQSFGVRSHPHRRPKKQASRKPCMANLCMWLRLHQGLVPRVT